ncbi:phosphoserine phosphatase SerB [Ornithinimicrobium sp. Y1694]|uniref:phosphoserine phosphatase SerB n=1 Tax=Ornithinimicrobium sp. Y1694 TaxID=3418590 RepID=UPI003CF54D15
MLVLTLLTAPDRSDLSPAALADLPAHWGVGEPRWLADGVAVETTIAAGEIPDLWDIWPTWQERGMDLVVQPAEGRRKQVLLSDMDSTMIQQECIDELADVAGFGERVSAITARAMNGELDLTEATLARVALLEGLPVSVVDTVLAERITLMPGGAELVGTMRAKGAYTALVSGGFTPFTAAITDQLGFHEHRANLLFDDGERFTGKVQEPVVGAQAKVEALEQITHRLGLTPQDAIAVGDGANDLGMLGRAGIGVALHAKPAVQERCDVRLNHADLTGVLYLQGYHQDDFVRP